MAGDVNSIKKVPGIGPKSAKRLLVELGDFSFEAEAMTPVSIAHEEARLALESLGFKKERISKALKACQSVTTEALIKEALKRLT
jgi:Holliday junction DNA helicase RuvA